MCFGCKLETLNSAEANVGRFIISSGTLPRRPATNLKENGPFLLLLQKIPFPTPP